MSKTSTTLSFRCPQDMLDAIDSIGREHYPSDKNSKTNSGCDRSKALFHIIQAGIAALTDGEVKIEVRQSKTDSNTGVSQGELEEIVKKLIGENLPVIQPRLTDDDSVLHLITKSIADGKIGEAIASSYAGVMGQINGLLEELQALQKQVQELQSIPPAPIPEQLTTDNGQLTKDVECDRFDSNFTSESQLIPDPTRNQIENIRTTLKRRGIQSVTNEKIRNAFKAAGWDGDNLKEIRSDILISLSAPK